MSLVVPPVRGLAASARHALVIAGLSALIALGAATSGALSPSGAHDAASDGSLDAVRSLLGLGAAGAGARAFGAAPPPSPEATPPASVPLLASAPLALLAPPAPVALPRFEATPAADAILDARIRGRTASANHSTATPRLEPGGRALATVSFYYCAPGPGALPAGDGGNFCGAMRDGAIVHSGAAACDYAYLGQRFRVEGDPTGRVYTCHDTGSAVHGLHRDIWFRTSDEGWRWQHAVGARAVIEVVP